MARVNISLPDELHRRAKDADLNISRLARKAIVYELQRRAKIAAAYEYLDELDSDLGPPTPDEITEAAEWADAIYGPREGRKSA